MDHTPKPNHPAHNEQTSVKDLRVYAVRAALGRRSGSVNALPSMKSGSRVKVTVRGVAGYGTVHGSYGTGPNARDAVAFVELDRGAGRFDIPWAFLGAVDE